MEGESPPWGPLSRIEPEPGGTRVGVNSPTLGPESPPLCSCGCGNPVSRRENGSRWNRYAFPRCRQRVSDRKLYKIQPGPECACGCGLPARLNKRSGKPTLYAADKCRVRAFELNKRFGLVGERPKICACGCGAPLEQTAKKPRKFATVQCRKRAWREVHRPNRVRRPGAGDVVAAPHFDIGNLAKWAKKSLVVPPGHPMAGKPMALPPFGRWFLRDVLKPETREALLCLGRKNAKSAIVALFCLGHLVGPLAGEGGWRAGLASVNKSKGRELMVQIEQIAEASGLADQLKFRRSPWPGSISSPAGTVEILAGDSGMGGHSASLDLAIVDELGLMSERDRELVASMRAATSAKDGKFIALSIWGSGPFIPEIVERRKIRALSSIFSNRRRIATYWTERRGKLRIRGSVLLRVRATWSMRRNELNQLQATKHFLGLRISTYRAPRTWKGSSPLRTGLGVAVMFLRETGRRF